MSDMNEIELAVASIEPGAEMDSVCETIIRLEAMMKRARELERSFKAALVEYIKAHGDVTIGTVRYYVAHPKKVECIDNRNALETLLETIGAQRTAECLASGAWKHGAVKSMLEEAASADLYDRLFAVTVGDKLEEGKPKEKQLQKFDSAFAH